MIKKNKKGFTLVELVVVVAVLLILAAIAIPTVSGVIKDAQASTDVSNAKSIETAIKYAIAENEIHVNDTAAVYSKATDVAGALVKSGMATTILTTKQNGMSFFYDTTTDTVTVASATTAVTTTFVKLADGTAAIS